MYRDVEVLFLFALSSLRWWLLLLNSLLPLFLFGSCLVLLLVVAEELLFGRVLGVVFDLAGVGKTAACLVDIVTMLLMFAHASQLLSIIKNKPLLY